MRKSLIFVGVLTLSTPVLADSKIQRTEVCRYYAEELYDMHLGGASFEAITQYITAQQLNFIQDNKDVWVLNKLLWDVYVTIGRAVRIGALPRDHLALDVLKEDVCPEWADQFPDEISLK